MDLESDCGIRWLTPSSLNLWREAPGLWVMEHLYGVKSRMNANLARTIAVKDGIKSWLYKGELGEAEDIALATFSAKMRGVDDPLALAAEDTILEQISGCVKEIQALGLGIIHGKLPVCCGLANSVWMQGITTPFLTAPDFVFEDQMLKVKVGARVPSSVQARDLTSCAVDVLHRKLPIRVIYASQKRATTILVSDEQVAVTLVHLAMDAFALQSFVGAASSRADALAMLPINHEHYAFNYEKMDALGVLCAQEKLNAAHSEEASRLRESRAGDVPRDLLPSDRPWDADD